jgi:hypothetical protein
MMYLSPNANPVRAAIIRDAKVGESVARRVNTLNTIREHDTQINCVHFRSGSKRENVMDKKTLVRWFLDLLVVVMLAYAGWSFGQFKTLNENDIRQEAQNEATQMVISRLADSVDELGDSLDAMAKQQEALVMVASFRTDPWSGAMMSDFQDQWFDLIKPIMPNLNHSDMPDVHTIQGKHAADLLPDGIFE